MPHTAEGLSHRLNEWTVRRPFLAVGCSAVVAVLPALWLPLWVAVLLAGLTVATLFFRCCRRPLWCLVALTVALMLLCTALFRWRQVDSLSRLTGQTDTITGQVVALPDGGRMVTVEVEKATLVPVGTQVALFLPEAVTPELWDVITIQVTLDAEMYSTYQPSRGVFLSAFPTEIDKERLQITDPDVIPVGAMANQHLYSVVQQVLPEEESGVLAALCLGRKEGLSPAVEEAFRGSGLSHLLVVSGLHLSLVVLALRTFLRRTGTGVRLSAALTIPMMALFMVLVGFSPSVMRAGLMCLCWLVGHFCRRRSEGLNSLGLAVTVLLLINPYQIYHAGFQLSFLATAGVLCLTPRLCGWLYRRPRAETYAGRLGQKAVSFVYTAAAVCVSAMLFTLPVSCYYFGGFSLSTVLSNLLAVIPAGWVLLCGWVGMLCCSVPFLAWLGRPILLAAGYGARYLTAVAQWCDAQWAQVSVSTLGQWLLLTAVCLLLIYALMKGLSLRRALPPLLALVLLAVSVGWVFTVPTTRLTVQPVSGGSAVLLEQGERTVLLVSHSRGLNDAAALLQERDCDRLDWLVVFNGSALDTGELTTFYRQTGYPQVATGTETPWYTGADCPVTPLQRRTPLTLWQGCTLSSTTQTWWRLNVGGAEVQIGADNRIPCPRPQGLAVYTGLPSRIHTPSVVTCTEAALTKPLPDYVNRTLLLTEDSVTFTVRPDGEWSVLPWL